MWLEPQLHSSTKRHSLSLIIEVFTISAPKEPAANATTGRTDSRQINGFADLTGPEPTLNGRNKHTGQHIGVIF